MTDNISLMDIKDPDINGIYKIDYPLPHKSPMMETTYAVTLQHTSPYIKYDAPDIHNFWYVDCPTENGVYVCADSSGNVQGSRYHNATGVSVAFEFYGKSIYLYGNIDSGMSLNISINEVPLTIAPSPANGILAAIDDWCLYCNGTCPGPESSGLTENRLQLFATQSIAGAKIYFTKAVFQYPTGRLNATTSIKTYQSDDLALVYSDGWIQNGTYMQSGLYNESYPDSRSLSLAFEGMAIWVWEFCGDRQEFESGYYGRFTINVDEGATVTMSSTRYYASIQDPKCLAFFWGDMRDTRNHLLLENGRDILMVHSIDVLQITGGTNITSGSTVAFINPFGGSKKTSSALMVVIHLLIAYLIATVAII